MCGSINFAVDTTVNLREVGKFIVALEIWSSKGGQFCRGFLWLLPKIQIKINWEYCVLCE